MSEECSDQWEVILNSILSNDELKDRVCVPGVTKSAALDAYLSEYGGHLDDRVMGK